MDYFYKKLDGDVVATLDKKFIYFQCAKMPIISPTVSLVDGVEKPTIDFKQLSEIFSNLPSSLSIRGASAVTVKTEVDDLAV